MVSSGIIALVTMLLMVSSMTAFAQTDRRGRTEGEESKKNYLYQWTGDDGVLHVADGLEKVPRKYRDNAVKLEQPTREEAAENRTIYQDTPGNAGEEGSEEDGKAEWSQRMSEAKQRLADADRHYRELGRQRDVLLSRADYAPLPVAVRLEAERIAEEMKNVQKEIDDARNMVEVIIPEEARRAGVPPGWLRE